MQGPNYSPVQQGCSSSQDDPRGVLDHPLSRLLPPSTRRHPDSCLGWLQGPQINEAPSLFTQVLGCKAPPVRLCSMVSACIHDWFRLLWTTPAIIIIIVFSIVFITCSLCVSSQCRCSLDSRVYVPFFFCFLLALTNAYSTAIARAALTASSCLTRLRCSDGSAAIQSRC